MLKIIAVSFAQFITKWYRYGLTGFDSAVHFYMLTYLAIRL